MKFFYKACALFLAIVLVMTTVPINTLSAFAATKALSVTKDSGGVTKDSGVLLDGDLDEKIWQSLQPLENQIVGTTATINSGFNVTWDNDNMYIGIKVAGADESKTSFDKDSISFYVSPKNYRGTPYSKDDFQVQIFDKGTTVKAGAAGVGKNDTLKVSDIAVKYQDISNGYTMEIAMPWSVVGVVPHDTYDMGFDLMAFDGGTDGDDHCVMEWSGGNWNNTTNNGTLTFTGDGTEPNGQTIAMIQPVFDLNTAIDLSYGKASDKDIIGIFPKDTTPSEEDQPILSQSMHGAQSSGNLTFSSAEIGNKLPAGEYEAIFYNSESYAVFAKDSFEVGEVKIQTDKHSYLNTDKASITVTYKEADFANKDWIGIYKADETPGSGTPSIAWAYTDAANGSKTFTASDFSRSTSMGYLTPGDYKAAFLADDGYSVIQSYPFTVTEPEVPQILMTATDYDLDFNISVGYKYTTTDLDWVGIYKAGTTPSNANPAYAYKYATGGKGSLTFTQQDVKDYQYSPLSGQPLTIGNYEMILMANDGYDILDRKEFTVTDYKPSAVTYDRTGARTGYADGKVTISDADHPATNQYILYWGDENGKLPGYEAIDTVIRTGNSTTYNMVTNTFIPQQATRLLAYGSDGNTESVQPASSLAIPENMRFKQEAPLYTFDVMSDTHIQSWDSEMNTHLGIALQDIKKNDPKSGGIFLVGDMVDQGFDENYKKFFSIVDANADGMPPLNLIMGNHEFMDFSSSQPYSNSDGKLQKWINNTGHTTPYYDSYISGQHFIMMGSEDYSDLKDGYAHDYCDISETQFDWLRNKLAETKDKKQPIFLFLHQPMLNTVAGSYESQGWNGVRPNQEAELRSILKDYPQTILFDGHTHWILQADHEMYDGKSSFASIFNTASAGYLWSDANETINGSQGLYVEVYKDKVLVKGRNYIDGTWIPKACFTVDLSEKFPSNEGTDKTVTSFDELKSSVKAQNVANGTALGALSLPSSLSATVNGTVTTIPGVTWMPSPAYAPNMAGTYTFTAVLPSGYVLAGGMSVPKITVTVAAANSTSDNGNSNHHSNNSTPTSSNTPNPVTTSSTPTGGTTTTVTPTVDTAPVVTGNQAKVAVTVPAEVSAAVTSATAQSPAHVQITAPTTSILEQLQNSAVQSVDTTITVPAAVANNTNANAAVSITAEQAVLQAAKDARKDVTLEVVNSETGKLAYSWTFKGADLASSTTIKPVDLAMSIHTTAEVAAVGTAVTAANKGVVLSFSSSNGILPSNATIRMNVADKGYKPAETLYFYYYNPATKALEPVGNTSYTVDKDGYVSVNISHCSDYVLLPNQVRSITLDTLSYTMTPKKSYEIGVKQTGTKDAIVKVYSSSNAVASVAKLSNGNYKVTGSKVGTTYIMFDVYDNKNKKLTHTSVRINVVKGTKPSGVSKRQIAAF
jgi:hypothetical protein